ncbi:LCP family protein [Nocardioides sp. LHG3406-4]|uniref:LCP family glycopolymer transferase n=1 Tax=Nocardioides sp. LHG3406-4 TaxID=2804575 RepID=UPI003CF47ECE
MRRAWIAFALIVLAIAAVVAALSWLLLHGHLELVAWLLAALVVSLVGTAVWQAVRGHRRRGVLLIAGAVLVAATVGGYAWSLNGKLSDIDRIDASAIGQGDRPDASPNRSINVLLMGADNPDRLADKPTVAELLADGDWDPGAYRSDTMMVVHIPADRSAAYVVSIPRDSYVPIHDPEGREHGLDKINAAFSAYGPIGTWRTVENLTGLRMNHMAIIDYAGFTDLTDAIGGVEVYIPEAVYDPKQHQQWEQGTTLLKGELSLKYVRMRYGLAEGDFSRVDRQQNFMRALMRKTLADDTLGNPIKLSNILDAIAGNLTVDSGWTNGDIRALAVSLRGLDASKVKFLTLPLERYDTVEGAGSVNIIDDSAARELWRAVREEKVRGYVRDHPEDALPDDDEVS